MQRFAVIFDFNGTMLFDTPLQYQAWNMLAEKTMGRSIGIDQFLRTANGRSSTETVDIFWGNSLTTDEKQALILDKRQAYKELCLMHPELFHLADGIPQILDFLKKHKIPFTIATSSNPASVDFYYDNLQLDRWFRREDIVCTDGSFRGKPAPDIYCAAAKSLHMHPKDCIVIEDAVAGAYAARGAGIGYVIVIDPEDSGLIWVGEQVDCVIQEHGQLYAMLCDKIKKKTGLS